MSKKEICINFCGGCNPSINRGEIAAEISRVFAAAGHTFSYNRLDGDIIICISGCRVNCAQKSMTTETYSIVVAGETVDAMAVEESKIVQEIFSKMDSITVNEKSQRNI